MNNSINDSANAVKTLNAVRDPELNELDNSIENTINLIFYRLLPRLYSILNNDTVEEENQNVSIEPVTNIGKRIYNQNEQINKIKK